MALTPLVLAVHGRPIRQAFGLGYLAGGVAFAGILAWIRVFGLLPWVLLSAYLALYPAAFAVVTRWCATGRPAWRWVWLAAIAWMGLEYLRSIGVFGFPWALLGLTQHRLLPVLQVARYTGVYGVSLLVALAGTSLAGVVLVRRPAPAIFPAIVLVLATGWGVRQAHAVPSGTIVTAAVQPNVPQAQKFDPVSSGARMTALQRLVGNAGRRGAELIVLPETAVPLNLFGPGGALVEVGRWAQQARATVIASSLENGVSNAAVAVAPSGKAVSRYDKVRLVAFGETGIVPGTSHEPLRTPLGRVGVVICFESIFPDVTRALVRNGAQILTVITNDAWLDGTAGPAQHAVHSVLRAVESGRWVVRAANTGPSMVIDPPYGTTHCGSVCPMSTSNTAIAPGLYLPSARRIASRCPVRYRSRSSSVGRTCRLAALAVPTTTAGDCASSPRSPALRSIRYTSSAGGISSEVSSSSTQPA